MNRLVITAFEHNRKEYTAYLMMDEQRELVDVQLFEPEDQMLSTIFMSALLRGSFRIFRQRLFVSQTDKNVICH